MQLSQGQDRQPLSPEGARLAAMNALVFVYIAMAAFAVFLTSIFHSRCPRQDVNVIAGTCFERLKHKRPGMGRIPSLLNTTCTKRCACL